MEANDTWNLSCVGDQEFQPQARRKYKGSTMIILRGVLSHIRKFDSHGLNDTYWLSSSGVLDRDNRNKWLIRCTIEL